MNGIFKKIRETNIFLIAFWLILIAGVIMRIHFHFMGRSLWEDEAHIALNFIHLDYEGLTQPLENYQTAPILFLFAVETFSMLFGFKEVVLRSFPFIISILAYPFFYFLVKDLTKSKVTALLCFLIFSVNASLIYYSSEIKSYTVDVSAFILLSFIAVSPHPVVYRNRRLLLTIAGAVSIVCSNVTPIVLICVGCYLLYKWKRKTNDNYDVGNFSKYLGVFACWLIVFGINYCLFIYNHPYGEGMKQIWADRFAPPNVFSKEFWHFISLRTQDTLFSEMLFLTDKPYFKYLTGILILTGVIGAIVKKQGYILFFTVLPILLHLGLSMLKMYPFFYRFILYLLPCFIILITMGIVTLAEALRRIHIVVATLFVLFCSYGCISVSLDKYVNMDSLLWYREIKPAINFINTGYPDTYIFITTPYTLYEYYLAIGVAKNTHYQAIDWNIKPSKYFEKVAERQTNYLLLCSQNGEVDGYADVLAELKKRKLIVNKLEHGSYTVMEVKPIAKTDTTTSP